METERKVMYVWTKKWFRQGTNPMNADNFIEITSLPTEQ